MSALGALPPDVQRRRVLGTKDAAAFIGLAVPTLRKMRDRKAVPSPVNITDRKLGWRIGDLMDFLDCRDAGREWKDCRGSAGTGRAA